MFLVIWLLKGFFNEYKLLIFVIQDFLELYLNDIKIENKKLILDLYGNTEEYSSVLLSVRISKDLEFDSFNYTIRAPREEGGNKQFFTTVHTSLTDIDRYDYELGRIIAPTHESIIINNYSLFNLYVKKNPGYTTFDISKYNEGFFKDNTLIIYNIDSEISFMMDVESVMITNKMVFTSFNRPQVYENSTNYFSVWIEIEKNEIITSTDYIINVKS